jgi:hypothetical protein
MALIFASAPEMIIRDGELIWPDDDLQHFTHKTGKGNDLRFLTIDTRREHVPAEEEVRQAIIYITKKEFRLSQRNSTESLPLASLNDGFKKNPLNLTSPESMEAVILASKVCIWLSLVFGLIFLFLGAWLFFIVMAWLLRLLSGPVISSPEKLDMGARKRIAALSVAPPVLLIFVLKLLFLPWKLFFTPLVILTGGLCFIKIHTSYRQTTEE